MDVMWNVNPVCEVRVNDLFRCPVVSLTLNQTLKAFSRPFCSSQAVLSNNHSNRWAVPLDLSACTVLFLVVDCSVSHLSRF